MNKKLIRSKDGKKVSEELSSTYGNTVVLIASNPEELDNVWSLVQDTYDEVGETMVLENNDYGKVIVRKGVK